MNDSERLSMAAHMHVALRRKVGRVTDTEWMALNQEYGLAMVDVALKHAEEHADPELGRLALRFGAALTLMASLSSSQGTGPHRPASKQLLQQDTLRPASDEAQDSSPWWDSHFTRMGRSTRMSADQPSTRSDAPSTRWPVSDLGPASETKPQQDQPMPLRRGRYVGGLR